MLAHLGMIRHHALACKQLSVRCGPASLSLCDTYVELCRGRSEYGFGVAGDGCCTLTLFCRTRRHCLGGCDTCRIVIYRECLLMGVLSLGSCRCRVGSVLNMAMAVGWQLDGAYAPQLCTKMVLKTTRCSETLLLAWRRQRGEG